MLIQTQARTTEEEGQRQLEKLLLAVAAGDREALAALYGQSRTAVYALALSYLHNSHDAQDVTQDTFIRVWDSAAQYRAQGSPMGWLLAICRNLSLMKLRQRGRQADSDDRAWDAVAAGESGLSPEDRALLQTALAALEQEERQVVLLHAVSGLKHREIAALLQRPLATILSKYRRALKKLRVHMEGADTP